MTISGFESLEFHPVRLAMRHRFRRVDHREAVLIKGPEGWGEFSPFPEYPPETTARWLASALESACTQYPPTVRDRIPVNVTVPAVGPDIARRLVADSGCSTAKVKVAEPGQDQTEDEQRVAAVRRELGPNGRIRLDANGAWDVETAAERIARLGEFHLEYVEQPVATVAEMAKLRGMVEVPIAADESIRTARDPMEVVDEGAADLLVLKVQPMGGVVRSLDFARRSGMTVVLSSALESSVGMAAGVWAAAALEELPHACGLATVSLLADDVVVDRLQAIDGFVPVRRPEPDPALLARYRPSRDQSAAMLARVRAAAELLS